MGKKTSFVLGLDLGVNSVGWSVVETEGGEPKRLIDAGARVFEAGLEGDIASGRGEPRNADRRDARQRRRQFDRRRRRKLRMLHLLQRHGLFPKGDPADFIADMDKALLARHASETGTDPLRLAHTLPYFLRVRALDQRLEPQELGRVLYHLAQRRGFNSNRRGAEDDKKDGIVKKEIGELRREKEQAGARTLGEYFASLDPWERRIRARRTSRQMYKEEFDAIMDAQARLNPELVTDAFRERAENIVFYQRPLKSVAGLVGQCEHEAGRRRAPWPLLDAQTFRLTQMVDSTRLKMADGAERDLAAEERHALVDALETKGDLTFAKARKLLGLDAKTTRFNWEEGGENRFVGNRTRAKVAPFFGERWNELSDADRNQVVEDLMTFEKKHALQKRAMRKWGLDPEAAAKFADIELEKGYCRLSRQALAKLLPEMRRGKPYMTAVKDIYGDSLARQPLDDALPRVEDAYPWLRNPTVHRVLTELRKVVNGIVRQYGKPERIRVELARDIKLSKKQRQERSKRNRSNETRREEAKKKILKEAGIQNPSRDDILRVTLAEECRCQCPYSGRQITMAGLFGSEPEFDIEHIVPFSRSLDNSYLNKTLCHHEENRNRKRNRTPWEAYGSDEEAWARILHRVESFTGDAAKEKLRRFKLTELDSIEEFASNQLNDTRYASRLATEYLACLYGGGVDEQGARRIQATRGNVTAFLRMAWGLNGILGDGGLKQRNDHRHHAVDAIAIALTTPATIKMLSDAAEHPWADRRRLFGKAPPPWEGFLADVRERVEAINVSRRPSRRIRGALHEETNYAPPRDDGNGKTVVHLRRPLHDLKATEVPRIVDDRVREIVQRKLSELGDMKKFQDKANHPFIEAADGRRVPIHKVRIRSSVQVVKVGKKGARYAKPGANTHMEIFESVGARGAKKWTGRVVTRFEAIRRMRRGEPVVRREGADGERFLFSLSSGDMLEIEDGQGQWRLVVARALSAGKVELADARDARIKDDIKKDKQWLTRSPDRLRQMGARKVTVTPLGEVRRAND